MTDQPTRFRHRVEEVDAIQWTGENADALRAFCGSDFDEIELDDRTDDPEESAAVREGRHGTWRGLRPGDWVVKLDGGLYEFTAGDFAEQYEPAASALPPADRAAECPRCRHDERTRGVLQLSALELYPPDHAPDCRATLRDRIAAKKTEPAFRAFAAAEQRAAEGLVADARRAVHEALVALAAPEADRVRSLIADLETVVEGRTAMRFTTLPAAADRAAVYAEVADRLAADAEQGAKDGFTRIYRRSAAKQVREWGEELHRVAAESAPATAPRPVQHAPGKAILCPGCRDKGHSACMADEQPKEA